ncbi:MAG: ABC transporter ATP-binding protein [Magnetococcales bacterium]|nr:ABC transporter ATP-binding protein [Magnetococcales bacterium]
MSERSSQHFGVPLLRATALKKSFSVGRDDRLEVLKGIDLELNRGEMVALLGDSGSGKSTLIQILGTLDYPTSGQVSLDGVDLFALDPVKQATVRNRKIGFIYQFHRLLPEFSAQENVMMPLLINRTPARQAEAKAVEALEKVGLQSRLSHRPGQLSGGEQQRVAIARAIVNEPALLLADEPTGNLDRSTAWSIFSLLAELNKNMGLSCLMVTHNHELAERLDRQILMVDGYLAAVEGASR